MWGRKRRGGAIPENGKFCTLDTFNNYFINNIILRELEIWCTVRQLSKLTLMHSIYV